MFTYLFKISELRSCVNVEVAVLGSPPSPYGLCGRKATFNWNFVQNPTRHKACSVHTGEQIIALYKRD